MKKILVLLLSSFSVVIGFPLYLFGDTTTLTKVEVLGDYCVLDQSGNTSSCLIDSGDAMYSGGFKNGEPHGYGSYISFLGGRYEGEFRDGKFNGKGIYNNGAGQKYEGEFRDDKFNGKGIYIDSDGQKYEGEFVDYKFKGSGGSGTFLYDNGNKYEGDFYNSKHEGNGIFEYANGIKIVGEYKKGKAHGYATMYHPSGDIYQGEFFEGKKNGKGICKLSLQTLQELEQGDRRIPSNLEKGQNIFECEYRMDELQYTNKAGKWLSELAAGLLGAAIQGAILGSMMEPCVPDVKSKTKKIPGGTKTTTTIKPCASPYQYK